MVNWQYLLSIYINILHRKNKIYHIVKTPTVEFKFKKQDFSLFFNYSYNSYPLYFIKEQKTNKVKFDICTVLIKGF